MDKQHLKVFKKIEKQVAEAEAKIRREELEAERAAQRARELRRQKIRERIVLGITFSFSCALIFLAWYSDGMVLKKAGGVFRSVGNTIVGNTSGDGLGLSSLDCSLPENRMSRQCQEERNAARSADWSGISLYDDGKENPFALHRKR